MSKTETGLDVEQVAQSSYRALTHAMGEAKEWGHLSVQMQMAHVHLARRAERIMTSLEGAPWSEVTQKLFACWAQVGHPTATYLQKEPFEEPPNWDNLRVPWEALARHLAILFDADEEDVKNLADLEASWRVWAWQRSNNLHMES